MLALSALAAELVSALNGARIDKIVQPEADVVRFFLRAPGRNVCLVASCNAGAPRLHLTESKKANPVTAPNFCMLLRKHLSNGAVEDVSMYNDDRIIRIKFAARTEMRDNAEFYLFVEIMNRYSNIVFTDADLTILDAVKHLSVDSGGHVVLRGVRYLPPEQPKPNFTKGMKAALASFSGGDLHRHILDNVSGLSGITVSEILLRAGVDSASSRLSDKEISDILSLVDDLRDVTRSALYAPCVIAGKDVYPFPYRTLKGEVTSYPDISSAYDAFYGACDAEIRLKARLKSVNAAIKRLRTRTEKNVAIDRQRLAECEEMDKWRLYGELIVANIYRIKKGDAAVTCHDYYSDREITVELDERLTPSGNSAAYYAKYNKLKRTRDFTLKKLDDDLALLDYVASMEAETARLGPADSSAAIEEELARLGAVKRKAQKNKIRKEKAEPPEEYLVDGFTVLAGKNNLQNEELTFRVARSCDIWLHAKNRHGAHVIVITGGKTPPDDILKIAGEIAAADAGAAVEVDYTERRNVKRHPNGHPGQVIYVNFKTMVSVPNSHKELKVK